MAFEPIFQPLKFRNLTVKNRIFRSNVSGRFDNYDGSGNQARINWEVKFAKGGVGAIISSFVPVHLRGPHRAELRDDRSRSPHPVLAGGRQRGSRARLPVHPAAQPRRPAARHPGHRVSDRPQLDRPSPIRSHGFQCEAMTLAEIRATVDAFAEGARRAREAGLDGVELHGANGYLITQFLSSAINDRKDEYGGSLENRARFVLDIVRAIRKKVGNDFHLQMKISVQEHCDAVSFFNIGPSGNTAAESVQVCKWLVEAGVDAIHASTGGFFPHPQNPAGSDLPVDDLVKTYDTMISSGDGAFRNYLLFRTTPDLARHAWQTTVPKPEEIEGLNLPDARRVKEAVSVPVICTGGFQTASVITAALERGDCDAVSIARPLIANNDLVEIFRRGQDRADRPCTYCNKLPRERGRESARLLRGSAISVARGDDRRDHVGVHAAAVRLKTPRREPHGRRIL